MKKIDLAGLKFGRLTVIKDDGSRDGKKQIKWLCKCECGNYVYTLGHCLKSGDTASCGCYAKEISRNRFSTHKLSKSREYRIWKGIKARCDNPKVRSFYLYGGKGISVCDRWNNSFENFLEDMGTCPDGYSIDRINGNIGYDPSNCRWVDIITQNNNRGKFNKRIEINGNTYTVAQLARLSNVSPYTIHSRLRRKKSINDLIINL